MADFMEQVTKHLNARGHVASFEFPGCIHITYRGALYVAGDANANWAADYYADPVDLARGANPTGYVETQAQVGGGADAETVARLLAEGIETFRPVPLTEAEVQAAIRERADIHLCGDCGSVWRRDDLADIDDWSERVQCSGDDITPSGECPECGALTYVHPRLSRWLQRASIADVIGRAISVCEEDGEGAGRDEHAELIGELRALLPVEAPPPPPPAPERDLTPLDALDDALKANDQMRAAIENAVTALGGFDTELTIARAQSILRAALSNVLTPVVAATGDVRDVRDLAPETQARIARGLATHTADARALADIGNRDPARAAFLRDRIGIGATVPAPSPETITVLRADLHAILIDVRRLQARLQRETPSIRTEDRELTEGIESALSGLLTQ